tara:strand:- start:696 stop:914 length:219 start_codon:yes stop_codon:yes gene_type:complete
MKIDYNEFSYELVEKKLTKTQYQKLTAIDLIMNDKKVGIKCDLKFKPMITRTLLKLSNNDLDNLLTGFGYYK